MFGLEAFAAAFLFFLECYHVCSHLNVLFRIRLLPRKDLVRVRYYFLFDLMTVFFSSFLFLQRLRWLAVIQILQHMYYFLFWEKTKPAKKIVSWSSLDWTASQYKEEWHFDSIIGTAFDIAVHGSMAFCLGQYLSTTQIFVSLFLAQCSLFAVLCGPWFAWSTPWAAPKWVQKRIRPLSEEDVRLGLWKNV